MDAKKAVKLDFFKQIQAAELTSKSSSGCLQVTSQGVDWRIYLRQGHLKSASSSVQALSSLYDRLLGLGLGTAAQALKHDSALWGDSGDARRGAIADALQWLQSRNYLNGEQVRKLVEAFSREALEPCFWLTEGEMSWMNISEMTSQMPALAIERELDFGELAQEFGRRLQQWQTLVPTIESPYQRPYLFAAREKQASLPPLLAKLAKFLRGGLSIQQLAGLLVQDELVVARRLYPHICTGEIYLREARSPFDRLPKILPPEARPAESKSQPDPEPPPKRYQIACIDDSPTVLDTFEQYLAPERYAVTRIVDPAAAAQVLFRLKPDLVLMDISMPEINGYKLCSVLRGSLSLRETPIIMVTGRTSPIDKVRAKMMGATDYLTKPFSKTELLTAIEKYLHSPNSSS